MNSSGTETLQPLSLTEQLDSMLLGWLERHADRHAPEEPGTRGSAIVTIADRVVGELERFCARWGMTAERTAPSGGDWAIVRVDGPVLPVMGFTAITDMYRA